MNTDICQLQPLNGYISVDLADTVIHTGKNFNVLIITGVTSSDDGDHFRVIISKNMYICSDITFNFMTLSIHVNTIIINRKLSVE
ncbi:hypothetical protein [Eudoraea sp.]|uniref:hypothetical protein n=1 Tax=Eudoraea sp. TaxID=1979955 RepID=UPI003C72E159